MNIPKNVNKRMLLLKMKLKQPLQHYSKNVHSLCVVKSKNKWLRSENVNIHHRHTLFGGNTLILWYGYISYFIIFDILPSMKRKIEMSTYDDNMSIVAHKKCQRWFSFFLKGNSNLIFYLQREDTNANIK